MQGVNRMAALITARKEQVCMDNIGLRQFSISGEKITTLTSYVWKLQKWKQIVYRRAILPALECWASGKRGQQQDWRSKTA